MFNLLQVFNFCCKCCVKRAAACNLWGTFMCGLVMWKDGLRAERVSALLSSENDVLQSEIKNEFVYCYMVIYS